MLYASVKMLYKKPPVVDHFLYGAQSFHQLPKKNDAHT